MIRRSLLALLLLAAPALAHEAPTGWQYEFGCCGSADCAEVAEEAIQEVPGGFRVFILPGTHPMVLEGQQPVDQFVAHHDLRVRQSGDWRKHACIDRAHDVLCIYIPPSGA